MTSSYEPFRFRASLIGRQAGTEKLCATLYELSCGNATGPLHVHHANEEFLTVGPLEGEIPPLD